MKDKLLNILNHSECPAEAALEAYSGNKLPDAEMRQIELHIAGCEMCSDMLEGLAVLHNPAKLDEIVTGLNKLVDNKTLQKKGKIVPFNNRAWAAIAAIGLILIAISTVYLLRNKVENQPLVVQNLESSTPVADSLISNDIPANTPEPIIDNKQQISEKKTATEKTVTGTLSNGKSMVQEPAVVYDIAVADEKITTKVTVNEDLFISSTTSGTTLNYASPASPTYTWTSANIQPYTVADSFVLSKEVAEVAVVSKKSKQYKNVTALNSKDSNKKQLTDGNAQSRESKAEAVAEQQVIVESDDSKMLEESAKKPMIDGYTYYQQKKYTQAVAAFENEHKANPENAKTLYYLGLSYKNLNNSTKAISCFDKVLTLTTAEYKPESKFQKALILIDLNRISEAKTLLNEVIQINGSLKNQADSVLQKLP